MAEQRFQRKRIAVGDEIPTGEGMAEQVWMEAWNSCGATNALDQ